MENKNRVPTDLEKDLKKIATEGIKADRKHLKKDMCAQFSDPREWAREYVVNAYDARASRCMLSGYENGDLQTIVVEDNGKGMDRQRILDFFTLYRSAKDIDNTLAVGRHGIGKLSVAAIPNQCGFRLISSTGTECWQAATGSLLDELPLILQRISPVPEKGTKFYITFRRSISLREELIKISDILNQYVRFLPLDIIVAIPESDKPNTKLHMHVIHDEWAGANYSAGYGLKILDELYNVYLSLGTAEHEIYQNRVFVTNKYNLLTNDLKEKYTIPYLKIVVESPFFELPFGRHCLSNEEVLPQLSQKIRTNLLPRFYAKLVNYYETGLLEEIRIPSRQFESLSCHLILHSTSKNQPWFEIPLFRLITGQCLNFNELHQVVKEKGVVYIEDDSNAGVDYTAIDTAVLKKDQNAEVIALVHQVFRKQCQNLSSEDLILEAPLAKRDELSEIEKTFEQQLGFHPKLMEDYGENGFLSGADKKLRGNATSDYHSDSFIKSSISKEAEDASKELQDIRWRVNYLLQHDARTPCKTHKYIFKNSTVIFNLHHSEIQDLVKLSIRNPSLAGHWAVSICLADEQNILPHLSAESREDLLLLDALAKAGSGGIKSSFNEKKQEKYNRAMRDFLRNADDSNYSLN